MDAVFIVHRIIPQCTIHRAPCCLMVVLVLKSFDQKTHYQVSYTYICVLKINDQYQTNYVISNSIIVY